MSIEDPIIESFEVTGFVKIAAVFLLGLMLLSGFGFAIQNDNPKSATITLTEIPQDGDMIMLGVHTFEFTHDGAVQSGYIPVRIGSTLIETKANFMAAVSANTDFSAE
jgi:hypothetical protein